EGEVSTGALPRSLDRTEFAGALERLHVSPRVRFAPHVEGYDGRSVRASETAQTPDAFVSSVSASGTHAARTSMSGSSSRQPRNPKSMWSRYDMTVALRPQSSKIGPSGWIATSWAPARYSGHGGPGTFDTTRLIIGRRRSAMRSREYARDARENSAGPATSAQSWSVELPTSSWTPLAPDMELAT